MKKLSPIAYVPRRGTVQLASPGPVGLYLGAFLLVSFFSSDPLVLGAATAGAVIAGYGTGAGRAVNFALKLGGFLAVTMVLVNAITTSRGATVLARLGEWPILGRVDVTAESIAAGGLIGLRVLGTMVAISVWSACVDPDRILRTVHGFARRSALTATLISRLVPLAATDYASLGEAASLRGPAATPVGRGAMAHRLLAGSLDRAVDVAATLELRGYGQPDPRSRAQRLRSRYDRRFWFAGSLLMAVAITEIAVAGRFETYPEITYATGPGGFAIAAAFLIAGFATWSKGGRK